jgi:predicted ATPase/DNA-binding SARP family transcriptional activator
MNGGVLSHLKVYLLGPPRAECDGRPVKIGRRKAKAILAYLAVTGEPQARDTLAALFWPESDQPHARASLRVTLSALKKAIGEEWLGIERESVSLKQADKLWLDVDRFHRSLDICRRHDHPVEERCPSCIDSLNEAVDLYRDDFMAGFSLRDSPDFDEWQYFQAEGLRRELAGVLERLARMHSAGQDFEPAIEHTRRWVEMDTLHEPAHRQLMQLYARAGQPAAALRQYETCVQILEEELGVPPQEETQQLHRAIQGEGVPPAIPAPLRYRHNLPYHATSFVGREREVVEIGQMIEGAASRLICLVGPGGIGKTRLALEVAAGRVGAFLHGVHFVPLAGVSSVDYLASAILDGMGLIPFGQEEPRVQLLNYLSQKEMLLVLDNFEHLLDGAKLLSEMLARAPGVKLLVTSRECLNVQGEWVIEVGGLRFPERGEDDDIEGYGAVQLFAQGARRACADFRLGQEEKGWVARICRLVEGMPLAIELAAAWARALSCAEIAEEIERGLDFLSSPRRDAPDRHQSLRATFDHSWGFLSDQERETFVKLSVFCGGFDREAAREVAPASPVLLARLVDKSFLRWNVWSGRYEVHELLRQYAAERLTGSMEEETRDRHCAYFAAFLGERERALTGTGQLEALQEIGVEIENVRRAWQWAVEQAHVEQLHQATDALFYFHWQRIRYREGESIFQQAASSLSALVPRSPDALDDVRLALARIESRQSILSIFTENSAQAASLLQHARSLLEEIGSVPRLQQDVQRERAFVLWRMAWPRSRDREGAQHLYEQSLALYQTLDGDRWWMAWLLSDFGRMTHEAGNYDRAIRLKRKSLEIRRALGDRIGVADSLWRLSITAWVTGRLEESERLSREGLAVCREVGDPQAIAQGLRGVGDSLIRLGKFDESLSFLEQSRAVYEDLAYYFFVAGVDMFFCEAEAHLGLYDRAHSRGRPVLDFYRSFNLPWEAGFSSYVMGLVALGRGAHEEAQRLLLESISYFDRIGHRENKGWVLALLGYACRALGQPDRAHQCVVEALQTGDDIGAFFPLIYALPAAALLLSDRGAHEQAVEVYALASRYGFVANSRWFEDVAGRRIAAAAAALPPDAVAAARGRGNARDIDVAVSELLVALEEKEAFSRKR